MLYAPLEVVALHPPERQVRIATIFGMERFTPAVLSAPADGAGKDRNLGIIGLLSCAGQPASAREGR